jgi:hypothetical protein
LPRRNVRAPCGVSKPATPHFFVQTSFGIAATDVRSGHEPTLPTLPALVSSTPESQHRGRPPYRLRARSGHSRTALVESRPFQGAERSARERIHLSSGRRPSKAARHRIAPVCARTERTPKLHRPARRDRRTPMIVTPRRACQPPTRRRDRFQRCFNIGQALSLSGRAACSADTVARSLR